MRFLAGVVLLLVSMAASAADTHGALDLFKDKDVTMAWAIARGADETRTMVVVRMKVQPWIHEVIVSGHDPFDGTKKVVAKAAAPKGVAEVRIPRSSFADLPKTEWRFLPGTAERQLNVFYLGIPDTTPEFADAAKLDAYLEQRLGKQ